MKRSPLARGESQLKRTAFPRQGVTREERPEKAPVRRQGSRRVDTGPSAAVRALVAARDDGKCLVCGGMATQVDHRRNRGMGNANRAKANVPSNLVSVCGMGGTDGCHGMITNPANFGLTNLQAQANGWNVSTHASVDTTTIPYLTYRGWVLLDDEGGMVDAPVTEFDEPS